jgi:hypothetical protein
MKKKSIAKKNNNYIAIISLTMVFLVVLLTIGWSAFNSTFVIDGKAFVRIDSEIRVTNFSYYSQTNNAISEYENYNVSSVTADAILPNALSTITYKVEVTNMQLPNNTHMGIFSLSGLPEELKIVNIRDYNLKDKICDDNDSSDCGTGAQKTFYIEVGYKDSSYFDASSTLKRFDINFDFRPFHNITYNNINGSYPTEIIEGDNLDITLSNVPTAALEISGVSPYVLGTDYTYSNNRLIINNITEDILVKQYNSYIIVYDANGGCFDDNSSITTNSVTYIYKNNQNIIISGTEKTPTFADKTFDNWYTDNTNYTSIFTTSNEINQSRTVYAKWISSGNSGTGTTNDPYINNGNTYDPSVISDGTSVLFVNVPGKPQATKDAQGNVISFEYTDLSENNPLVITNNKVETGVLALDGNAFSIHVKFKATLSQNNNKFIVSALEQNSNNTYSGFSASVSNNVFKLNSYTNRSRSSQTGLLTANANTNTPSSAVSSGEHTFDITITYDPTGGNGYGVLEMTLSVDGVAQKVASIKNKKNSSDVPKTLTNAVVTLGGNGIDNSDNINNMSVIEFSVTR